jgi:hypothetical protein
VRLGIRDAECGAVGDLDRGPRQVQGNDGGVGLQGGCQAGSDFVVLPRVQIDDLSHGEQLGHGGGEDAEVGTTQIARGRVVGVKRQLRWGEAALG